LTARVGPAGHVCMGVCYFICVCLFACTCWQAVLAVLLSQFDLSLKPGAEVKPKVRVTMQPSRLPMLLRHLAPAASAAH
jgi:hypothetical protein